MKPQHQIVLEHLKKYGSISSYEAEKEYGITRLIHRILYLRAQGYVIMEEWGARDDRWGKTHPVLIYVLSNDDNKGKVLTK